MNKIYRYFGIFLIASELFYWIIMLMTRSSLISTYFLNDFNDTSMDYFNMLANLYTLKPYENNANYPALCFLIWRILYHLIPLNPNGGDGFYLRSLMHAQIGYILYTGTILIIIWEIVKNQIKSTQTDKYICAVGIMLSGPILFTVERGNIILLSFLFLLIFTSCYDSPKRYIRWCGYVALSISAAIKIYPALFGLLVLNKKRYKESFGLTVTGLIVFITPFFAFDGIQSIKDMINGILISGKNQSNFGMGYNFSFTNLIKIFSAFQGRLISDIPKIFLMIPLVWCLVIFILSKEEWQKMSAISLICIWLPTFSYTYTLILFIIPFLKLVARDYKQHGILDYIYMILFIIILTPSALPSAAYLDITDAKFPATWPTIIINLAMMALAIFMMIDVISQAGKSLECGKLNDR